MAFQKIKVTDKALNIPAGTVLRLTDAQASRRRGLLDPVERDKGGIGIYIVKDLIEMLSEDRVEELRKAGLYQAKTSLQFKVGEELEVDEASLKKIALNKVDLVGDVADGVQRKAPKPRGAARKKALEEEAKAAGMTVEEFMAAKKKKPAAKKADTASKPTGKSGGRKKGAAKKAGEPPAETTDTADAEAADAPAGDVNPVAD